MTFREKLIEYYRGCSDFLYMGKIRDDIIKIEVLEQHGCRCSYVTKFGKCNGIGIKVHYKDRRSHATCPIQLDILKFDPIRQTKERW